MIGVKTGLAVYLPRLEHQNLFIINGQFLGPVTIKLQELIKILLLVLQSVTGHIIFFSFTTFHESATTKLV